VKEMKKLINDIFFGTNAKFSGVIALAIIGLIALGCSCGKDFNLSNIASNRSSENSGRNTTLANTSSTGSDAVPSESEVESLVKDTTALFAEAVDSGDFSEIYAASSTDFQNTYTVDEMTTAFKSYTDKKSVVVPILNKTAASDAEFTSPPSIRNEKGLDILVAKGTFPTKPYNVRFDYEYVNRGGDWKLLKLVINIP
jgi:hypothetical protein